MSKEAITYLESHCWLATRLGLERIVELMDRLGAPQEKVPFIHLAGTNGKGSTAAFLASILQAAGYKTGLYTSPFIHTFHERMQVNGEAISADDLDEIVDRLRPIAASMDDHPSTFELVTATAFCWFAKMECDIVVLETGMGGALDATNVISAPEVSVITPIDMDHMEFLGDSIEKIARTKAGIIKPGRPIVSAPQQPAALAVLKEVSSGQNAPFAQVDLNLLSPGAFSLSGQTFSFAGMDDLSIGLLGSYQMENAALAILTCQTLNQGGRYTISESAIRQGLSAARWPGRFELSGTNPHTIVDGGHNAQGAAALGRNLARYFPGKQVHFVMGILKDKDLSAILDPILPLAAHFHTITPDNPRAMSAGDLAEYINSRGGAATAVPTGMVSAINLAKQAAGEDGILCYFGSLYSVGEARAALGLWPL